MIFYIASQTYQQVINQAIQESEEILIGGECRSDIYLLKYVKENGSILNSLDCLLVDISALEDTDEEILQSLEILRMMHDNMRLIILAANRADGDNLLTQCFNMSIYNLINTDDFVEIRDELKYCIITGMQYKDAVKYKESNGTETVIVKQEIKQTVNKVLVGIAGSEKRIGVTHNSIILANYLRKRGFMVALAEYGQRKAFCSIQEFFEEKLLDNMYFTMNGVDYYADVNADRLGSILGKSYNFVLVDFGMFEECDRITFNKCNVRIIVTGSKPWEVEQINAVFGAVPEETLKMYHFCFNFTKQNLRSDVEKGMEELGQIHFLEILEDPFSAYDFADAESILQEYMPVKMEEPKKRRFWLGKKGKSK